MTENFEQWVLFTPAYDKRHTDPSKNYGIGSVSVQFCLKGPDGGVTFSFLTDWYLPQNVSAADRIRDITRSPINGWGVDVHCKKQMYDWQDGPSHDDCKLTGGACWSDGSALLARDWCDILIREGSDKIWELMRERYAAEFGCAEVDSEGAIL